MNVKLNDNVLVIAGKDKGKIGKVVSTSPKAGRVTVQGVNLQKKHKKARKATEVSSIVEREGAIDVSNVMVVCDKCGSVLDKTYKKQAKAAAKTEEAPKKRTRKRTAKKEETVSEENKD